LKLDEKKLDSENRGPKKESTMPESTKSQGKTVGDKPPETIESTTAPATQGEQMTEQPVEEPKKPRYFPPRKLPNPFESAA
jgi:hypothetical protein